MQEISVEIIKLFLAVLLGGLLGIEREFRDKAAGFRTVILICLGATLFTIVSIHFYGSADPARIAAQIVTGVGFLGAGAILREGGRIVGLTTAALIWMAAAIGMAIGSGRYILAITATAVISLIMWVFPKIEAFIDQLREIRTYEVICENTEEHRQAITAMFTAHNLNTLHNRWVRRKNNVIVHWRVYGRPEDHEKLVEEMLTSDKVKVFTIQE